VNPRAKLLVVDDDVTLLQLLELSLTEAGYEVMSVSTGLEAMRAVYASPPDLIVLDIMIPDISGWVVCERLRDVSQVPIIMLTACDEQDERVRGLELGADDYISKPFDVQELILRIGAVLRRTLVHGRYAEGGRVISHYDDGDLYVNLDNRIIQYKGREIYLTPHEFDLLACFVKHAGKTLTREYLLREVWGLNSSAGYADYVKTYIRYLRKKIEPDPAHPQYIITERGIGYRLALRAEKRASRFCISPDDQPA